MKPFARLSVLLARAPFGALLGSLSKNYTFSTSDIHIDTVEIEGRTYHEVFLEDCINDANFLGDPSLPVMDVVFIITAGLDKSKKEIIIRYIQSGGNNETGFYPNP
ncbi:hypothetical protein ES703_07080 [subsurface metagenome]